MAYLRVFPPLLGWQSILIFWSAFPPFRLDRVQALDSKVTGLKAATVEGMVLRNRGHALLNLPRVLHRPHSGMLAGVSEMNLSLKDLKEKTEKERARSVISVRVRHVLVEVCTAISKLEFGGWSR